MGKKVIITGASGMIGGLILDLCLKSDQVSSVISLVRKPAGVSAPKLEEVVVSDFKNYEHASIDFNNIDITFFCIGVYTGAVPREIFREITIDYPVALAKALYQYSPELTFCLLSGAGADRAGKRSTAFAKDKGIAENKIAEIGFSAFHTFRPAYIYPVTKRKEPNLMYTVSRKLYPLIKLMGKDASITSVELAGGMFNVGMNGYKDEVLENRAILEVCKST